MLLHGCEVFQPHYQRVTQIESFELDGVQLVVTASVDQCIVLCTITGEKVRREKKEQW